MKGWKIFWGLGFILAAVLIVLDAVGVIAPLVGVMGEISVFALLGVLFFLAMIISLCVKGKLSQIFFPLAFIFMIIEKNIAKLCGFESDNIIHNGLVLLIALFLSVGFGMLFSSKRRKRKKHGYTVTYNINDSKDNDDNDADYGDADDDDKKRQFAAGGSLGSHTVYVDCKSFCPDIVENNLGACVVHFENVEEYVGNKTLRVDNNLGAMTINVPSSWHVVTSIDNNLGDVKVPANEAGEGAPALFIEGDNNMGAMTVKFV